jgi:hypothetical protein
VKINGNSYFIAIQATGAHLNGKVLIVTPAELILMDEYETSAYIRVLVTLQSGLEAWVYCRP